MAGSIPCTKANFETTPADQVEIAAWAAIFSNVRNAALPPEPAPYLGNSAGLMPSVATQHLVIRAALEARNLADFQGRTWQWIESEDSARLFRAIAHFRARLHPSERKEVKTFLPQLEKEFRKNGAPALAAQMAHFFESHLKTQDVYFHLIPGDAAKATHVSNHVFMEITSSAKPAPAASLMLHELTRYFYDSAPARKHAALMQQFAQSGAADASSLYALLSEAVAQATVTETPSSTEFIPRVARVTTPLLKESLSKGTTLFDPQFVQAYIREANRELGADTSDPRFVLNSAAFLPTDKAQAAYELLLKELQPISFIRSGQWQLFSNENLVFLTAYDEWGLLPNTFPELTALASKRGFVYTGSANGRTICIVAGRDSDAMVEAVKAFVKIKSLPKPGLVLSID